MKQHCNLTAQRIEGRVSVEIGHEVCCPYGCDFLALKLYVWKDWGVLMYARIPLCYLSHTLERV